MRTRPLIIAHRGLSGSFPENTLRAFNEALMLPIDAIEFDVRMTKDGTLIVIHDETVDRTTNGHGRTGELTWDEIRELDAGIKKGMEFSGERIPSLDETLKLVDGQKMVLLEIKEPGMETQILDTLNRCNALDWVNLVSFHCKPLILAKKLAPLTSCTLIGGADVGASDRDFSNYVNDTLSCSSNSVMVHYSALNPERVYFCHRRHLFVGAWTVDNKDLADKLVFMGVDGIATNHPDIMLEVID